MLGSLGALLIGTLLGVRHAFEPDHLTAVTTLVLEARGAWRGATLGALWGLGHTISLLVVGTAVLATGTLLPPAAAAAFELCVALVLIGLGGRAVWRVLRAAPQGAAHMHAHGDRTHAHAAGAAHLHVAGRTVTWRPLLVGLVHGLAGTGALTALVFAQLPDLASRVSYIALFGLGSVAGMALATGVAGASLARLVHTPRRRSALALVTGVGSMALGVAWGLPELAILHG